MLQGKPVWALAAAALLAIVFGCAAPMGGPREDASAGIDPKAADALKRMCEVLSGAKFFAFEANVRMDERLESGQLAQFTRTSRIVAVRPDRLHVKTDAGEMRWSAWYGGSTLVMLDENKNAYAEEPVRGTIVDMLDQMATEYNLVMPMVDLLVDKVYDSLTANVRSAAYLGLHLVGDRKCHHLLFRQQNIDWQIWIDAGDVPLPRKLTITYKLESDQPQFVAVLDGWDLAPKISSDTFKFTPPADAKKVSMFDLLGRKRGGKS